MPFTLMPLALIRDTPAPFAIAAIFFSRCCHAIVYAISLRHTPRLRCYAILTLLPPADVFRDAIAIDFRRFAAFDFRFHTLLALMPLQPRM